ncbi:MAG: chemotaxis-specific protein-glutamate methyltransferase CheB [Lachnospiraceae bacterium]|nr:chemotaxis-specific protein-glutamate methyltransferase CheB [Lachnospiraceae bacterium]
MGINDQKKILIVDDSALMRRIAGDIIDGDSRYHVEDKAHDGLEALELLQKKRYDAVVLDVNMPRMSGLELLRELQKQRISARVLMFSSTTGEGTKETIEALELGAVDFIQKPAGLAALKDGEFKGHFLELLAVVAKASLVSGVGTVSAPARPAAQRTQTTQTPAAPAAAADPGRFTRVNLSNLKNIRVRGPVAAVSGEKCIAIACSTGGPKALQSVIPYIPAGIDAPILLVQHMPAGFTKSLAERLDTLSKVRVREAQDGDLLEKGTVYLAAGGKHMKVGKSGNRMRIFYTDEPAREGVKPSANYMYESLMDSPYAEICCAVLTGMGADGTAGIENLEKHKKIYVVAQDEATSAVYGMPRAIALTGLVNEIVPLQKVAETIAKRVGVR